MIVKQMVSVFPVCMFVVTEFGEVELGEQRPANCHSSGGALYGEAAEVLC